MPVVKEYKNAAGEVAEMALSDGTHRVMVSRNFKGKASPQWIITAYGPEGQ